jgi:hypothetical protein
MIWIAALLLLTVAGCTYIKMDGEGNTVEVREASVYVEAEVHAKADEEQELVEIKK